MKKILSLLALVLMSCMGAWADETRFVKGAAISAQTNLQNGDLVILGVKSHGNTNEAHLMYANLDAEHPYYRTNYRAHRDAHEFYDNDHVWKVVNVNNSTTPATFQLQSLANEAAFLPNGNGFDNGTEAANIYLQAVTAYDITTDTRDYTPRFAIRFTNKSTTNDTYHFNGAIGDITDSSNGNAQIGFWGAPNNPSAAATGTDTYGAYAFYKAETITYTNTIIPTYVSTNGATGNEGAAKMVDGNVDTKWGQGTLASGPYYVILKAGESPVCVKGYSLWNGNDTFSYQGRRATAWKLQGSNDADGEWHDIDVRSNEVMLPENKKPNTYKANNTESYTYYKLTIEAIDTRGEHGDMFQFSEFKLYTFTEGPNWAGLEAIIAEAESYPYGDGLGQYSNSQFAGELGEAQQMLEYHRNGLDAEKEQVDEAISNLRTAINNLTLNMPATGKFYRFKGQTGRYINSDVVDKNSDDQGLYTMKDLSGNENKTIFYLTDDNHLIAYATGMSFSWGWKSSTLGANHDCTWTISEAEVIGKYIIECPDASTWGNQKYLGDVTNQAYLNRQTAKDANAAWTIEEVDELPVTLNANSGCASFYAPVAMTVTEGDAYIAVVKDASTITLSPVADNVIPAGFGVILKGTGTATLTVGGEATEDRQNALKGSEYTKVKPTDEGTIYVLVNNNGAPAFQMYSGANVNGFKAYLPIQVGGESNLRVIFDEGFATGIEAIENNAQSEIFDLQGRRVQNVQRGLYIVNGKKVIR